MASTSDIRTGKHVEYRNKECHDMNTESIEISRWLRAGIVGIALSLATVQTAGADTLRPTVDTGGPGGGTSSAEVYYELEYEQGRPVVIEQADSQSAELAAYERAQQPNTSAQEDEFYAIAHEHGNGTFAEQPNASASAGGWYVIVDDLGNASAPEQMTGQTASSAEAPAFAAHPNLRSIQLIEGKAVANDSTAPAFAVHPNLRSIQLIEGKAAVAEVARPASASAYSVCLACSTLG